MAPLYHTNPMRKVVFYRSPRNGWGPLLPARLATAPANLYLVHQLDAESERGALQEVHRNVPTFSHPTRRRRDPRDRHARARRRGRGRQDRARTLGSTEPVTLRLGYFPNVTHASAIVGVQGGIFAKKLGTNVDLEAQAPSTRAPRRCRHFKQRRSTPAYIGPNPTITAWTQFDKGVKVISGAVLRWRVLGGEARHQQRRRPQGQGRRHPAARQHPGRSLRTWLKKNGLNTDTRGGGDVSIRPQDNATSLNSFKTGDIQGAWVPEPWATRLVTEGGGKILVDEAIAVAEGSVRDHAADRHHELPQGTP